MSHIPWRVTSKAFSYYCMAQKRHVDFSTHEFGIAALGKEIDNDLIFSHPKCISHEQSEQNTCSTDVRRLRRRENLSAISSLCACLFLLLFVMVIRNFSDLDLAKKIAVFFFEKQNFLLGE